VSETAYELGAVLGTVLLGGTITALYRAWLVIPENVSAAAGDAARETLAGAYTVAQDLGGASADALWDAAVDAFESGVAVTSFAGAVLVAIAALIAVVTLRTRSTR
jgi:DHA2 family multidrug resistance protein-like MFS transporter